MFVHTSSCMLGYMFRHICVYGCMCQCVDMFQFERITHVAQQRVLLCVSMDVH